LHLPFLALDDWRWDKGLTVSAPHLRSLVISAEAVAQAFDGCGFTTCFPWTQLTTLEMLHTSLDADIWHDILRQCTLLCVGSFTIQSNASYINRHSIILSNLHSLNIRFQSEFQTRFFDDRIFRLVSFPVLNALHITARLEWSDSAPFVEWMRQQDQIRNLTLEVHLADGTLLDLLRSLRKLEELTLSFHYGAIPQCRPFFQAVQESCLQELHTLAIFGVMDPHSLVAGMTSRVLLHHVAVFDLVKTATTWAALGPKMNWEFRLFAEGAILSDVRAGLHSIDSTLVADSLVTPSIGVHDRSRFTGLRVRRRHS
jgi:hypothetical protein